MQKPLCVKWTAGTPKKKRKKGRKKKAEDIPTVLSIHRYYLNQTQLKQWRACVSVCTPTSNEQTLRGIMVNHILTTLTKVFTEIVPQSQYLFYGIKVVFFFNFILCIFKCRARFTCCHVFACCKGTARTFLSH